MVLPKELRKKAGIKPGDKLAVVCIVKNDRVHCITLVKADELGDRVRVFLKLMLKDVVGI